MSNPEYEDWANISGVSLAVMGAVLGTWELSTGMPLTTDIMDDLPFNFQGHALELLVTAFFGSLAAAKTSHLVNLDHRPITDPLRAWIFVPPSA